MPILRAGLPPEQQALRDQCFHPSGTFVEFEEEEIEQSISDRFEDQVRRHAARLALETAGRAITYGELNEAANRIAHAILAARGERPERVALLFHQGDQPRWVERALEMFGRTFGGATAYPKAKGIWRDDLDGQISLRIGLDALRRC
jgi:non-ribosomal peptide synthetase component F